MRLIRKTGQIASWSGLLSGTFEIFLKELPLELEIIRGDMPPTARGLIDYLDEGLLAGVLGKIPTGLLHYLIVNAPRGFKLPAVLRTKGDVGRWPISTADSKGHFAALWHEEGRDDDAGL